MWFDYITSFISFVRFPLIDLLLAGIFYLPFRCNLEEKSLFIVDV